MTACAERSPVDSRERSKGLNLGRDVAFCGDGESKEAIWSDPRADALGVVVADGEP